VKDLLKKQFFELTLRFPYINSILVKLGWKKALLQESSVFCMAPWIQLHAQTNGHVAPCCMADAWDGRETGNLKENAKLNEQWNSSKMKELRLNMLKGKESPICGNCYKYESFGKVSERNTYNRDHFRHISRLLITDSTGYLKTDSIPLIDLRFNNKCNYKCRICNSEYSSLWYEDELKVGNYYGNEPVKLKSMTALDSDLWTTLDSQLATVQRIHFAGGEPLYMDEHYRVLEKLLELGNNQAILSYNTNFSTLRYKNFNVVEIWSKFKNVDIWASLDGMGAKGDYQRKGQRWNKIEENIREIQKSCPQVIFGVNITVSIFNIFDITDFYEYLVINNLAKADRVNLYLLFGPECFSIAQLSLSLKDKAMFKINEFLANKLPKIPNSSNFKNHLLSVQSYLTSHEPTHQEELRDRIKKVDTVRDEKFEDLFPELAELIN
jgi:organic radical activating enzyme